MAVLGTGPQLQWEAPAECPSAASVRARIDGLVTTGRAGLVVSAVVSARSDGYGAALVLERDGVRSTRELVGASCDVLADAVAVVIAIENDGPLAPAPDPPRREPEPKPEAEPESTPVVSPSPGPATTVGRPAAPITPRGGPRIAVRAAGGVDGRGAPGLSGVVELGVGVRWSRWDLDLGLAHVIARTHRLSAPLDDVGARVGLWSAAIGGAFVPAVGRVAFPLGLRIELGDAIARGFGDDSAQRVHALWLAARIGAGLRVRLGDRVALGVEPSLAAVVVRPRFAVRTPDGPRDLARAARIGLRLQAGVEVRFR